MIEPVEHLLGDEAVDLGDDGAGGLEGFRRLDGNLAHRGLERLAARKLEHQAEPQFAR